MRPHARPDHRDLSDPVVVQQRVESDLGLQLSERGHRSVTIVPGQGEGNVRPAGRSRRDVLNDHVDVEAGLGDGAEDPGGLTDLVGNADNRDLCLTTVLRYAGDDRLLHRLAFRCR